MEVCISSRIEWCLTIFSNPPRNLPSVWQLPDGARCTASTRDSRASSNPSSYGFLSNQSCDRRIACTLDSVSRAGTGSFSLTAKPDGFCESLTTSRKQSSRASSIQIQSLLLVQLG